MKLRSEDAVRHESTLVAIEEIRQEVSETASCDVEKG